MEVLNINTFLSFKKNDDVQKLDNDVIELFNKLFGNIDKYAKKKIIKKPNINILKNQKIQNKKDNIINKVNLILNKLSESNLDNLIIEFIENINQVNINDFEEIQKTFYFKILSEINFVKIYLQFLKNIAFIYNKALDSNNYNLFFFYSIVESKFKADYTNFNIIQELNFINKFNNETDRINNLIIIQNLVENGFLSENVILSCDNIILNQSNYLPDIYYWFHFKNRELTSDEKNKIKILLKKDDIILRESLLLETLIKKEKIQECATKCENKIKDTNENIIKTDTINLECDNILEEYLLYKSIDDIEYFINNRCNDAITKNKFCEILVDKILLSDDKDNIEDLIKLINKLINERIVFKSNLSKGLLLLHSNEEKLAEYDNYNTKIKKILFAFKNLGITKGIEFLIDKHIKDNLSINTL